MIIPLLIVIAVSALGLTGGIFLIYREKLARFISKYIINFSIGTILGVVFLDLLPEAVKEFKGEANVLIYPLIGILLFYLMEKTLLWYHHHSEEQIWHKVHPPEEKTHPVGYLITVGDSLHNFIDGVIIAAAFLIDFKIGLATSLAVLFHELPQEIGEFAILLHAGFSRGRIILLNIVAQTGAVLGFLVGFAYLSLVENLVAIFIGTAAGGFIYIASTDLLPETHRERSLGKSAVQVALLTLGIVTIWFVGQVVPE